MSFTQDQLRNIGILQKTAGAISTICSTYLVVSVLSDEKKRSRVYHRLIAGISIFDAINSFNLFLSTWPIPKGEMLWAVGNDTTCNIQGFVAQLVLGNALYNASLAVYYLLVINYGWKETQIIKVEPYLHALPVVSTLATATYAWIKDMYRNSFFWCWISADLKIYRFTLFYIPNWICIGFITVVCILVFRHVRQVEARASQYRSGHSEIYSNDDLEEPEQAAQRKKKSNQKDEGWRTRMVATQCFLYATAFYFVWAGATTNRILGATTGKTYYGLLLYTAFFTPIQGLPNFLVYLLPKFQHIRQFYREQGLFAWIRMTLTRNKEDDALDAAEMMFRTTDNLAVSHASRHSAAENAI